MTCGEIVERLRSLENRENVAGMARYGISTKNTLGVSMVVLRAMGREIGKNHGLALELWETAIHEGRILATLLADADRLTPEVMDAWAADFDSWDVCDQTCNNLFRKTRFAHEKALVWSRRPEEFVKRAGFVLMACLSVHDKSAGDDAFLGFLKPIREESIDERNFVKKAVNWALRGIGKRNEALNRAAVQCSRELVESDSKAARWTGRDALRELESEKVLSRLKNKRKH
jgi:3-methyladenine DNA glycosylase AlkD